ncbi:hypothetical protein FJQ98_14830 [Lysinibacillus agricola]|uniref:Uncharacterized protein n=1 Tax=Lysinibacillus agricola TaxID=2590012 RepID=A0ABX7ANR2_9BACI|nr:hypothetical protein [Lysinibacillus agricola]QQP10548.1 hypothetical protein FJQ98_14830 [Lysinibacillus agricola]
MIRTHGQQQMFSVAEAKRQQQMFSVRKRSDSNKCFLCESEATATNVFCAKAKRQPQLRQGDIVVPKQKNPEIIFRV